jgi:methylmalonyl-CoA/ethylmalonyl-CoA epimerase
MKPRLQSLHNVGVAVRSLDKFVSFLCSTFDLPMMIERIAGGLGAIENFVHCRTAFLRVGNCFVEGIEPLPDDRPLNGFIQKYGEGFYRVLYYVDDFESALARIRAVGAGHSLVRRPGPEGGEASMVLISPRATSGVLVELADEAMFALVARDYVGDLGRARTELLSMHNISVAVHAIDDALVALSELFEIEPVSRLRESDSDTAFIKTGQHYLRLVSPRGDERSDVRDFLTVRGEGLYLVGVTAEDMETVGARLSAAHRKDTGARFCGDGPRLIAVLPEAGGIRVEVRSAWPVG